MVKLREIEQNNERITCVAFVEDCEQPIDIEFNTKDETIRSSPLPEGYEWCTSHIAHVRRTLKRMADENSFVSHTTVMWY